MTEVKESYEHIRKLFNSGNGRPLPKHELTNKLIKTMYHEEEASLIYRSFKEIKEYLTVDQISERSGIEDKEKLKEILEHMVYKGTLLQGKDSTYYMFSYLPGIFEAYFTRVRDDPERLREAGIAHRELRKISFNPSGKWPFELPTDFNQKSPWRFVPAMEPVIKTIEINKELDFKNEILPFEVLEKQLSAYEVFTETPCSCRETAKLANEPCERTSENFCIQAGEAAKRNIKEGIGKQMNYEEAMKRLKEAEENGLVHSTDNKQDPFTYVCNCCPCCCMALEPVMIGFKLGAAKSNFDPVIDYDLCILCDTCVEICPTGIIEHIDDEDGEKITFNLDECLGCGLCASNCPEEAISLEKVRSDIPRQSMGSLFG
ncbi:MAG: ATP-binding protein [Promethearchaeota archaeon]|jgi:Pyruvate/2-oxoacid:ferredoxin oxidoreductase delta subunit